MQDVVYTVDAFGNVTIVSTRANELSAKAARAQAFLAHQDKGYPGDKRPMPPTPLLYEEETPSRLTEKEFSYR